MYLLSHTTYNQLRIIVTDKLSNFIFLLCLYLLLDAFAPARSHKDHRAGRQAIFHFLPFCFCDVRYRSGTWYRYAVAVYFTTTYPTSNRRFSAIILSSHDFKKSYYQRRRVRRDSPPSRLGECPPHNQSQRNLHRYLQDCKEHDLVCVPFRCHGVFSNNK